MIATSRATRLAASGEGAEHQVAAFPEIAGMPVMTRRKDAPGSRCATMFEDTKDRSAAR